MKLLDYLIDYKNPDCFCNTLRKKRYLFFKELIKDYNKPTKILDLGGFEKFWVLNQEGGNKNLEITLLNLKKEKTHFKNIKSIKGDARDLRQFKDNEFDVVFSNSVIEHLYDKIEQIKMAKESIRVGKTYFIQTPNLFFPIEPHFLFPFFQFLPYKLKVSLVSKLRLTKHRGYDEKKIESVIKQVRLLTKKELKEFFPNCKIYKEKFLGMTKSFIAYNFNR